MPIKRFGRGHRQAGLGLDLDGQVCLAEIEAHDAARRPLRCAYIEPSGTPDAPDGPPEAYAEGLREVVHRWGLQGRAVTLSLPSSLVVVRQVHTAADASPAVVRTLVERDVIGRLPIGAAAVAWDFYPVERLRGDDPGGVVVAADQHAVRQWVAWAIRAGLRPTAVEPSVYAALRWVKATQAIGTAPWLLVTLTRRRVLMALIRGAVPVSVLQVERSVQTSLDAYASEVAQDVDRAWKFLGVRDMPPLESLVVLDLVGAGTPVEQELAVRSDAVIRRCPLTDPPVPSWSFPGGLEHPGEATAPGSAIALGLALRRWDSP
jgi:hypothetical protein